MTPWHQAAAVMREAIEEVTAAVADTTDDPDVLMQLHRLMLALDDLVTTLPTPEPEPPRRWRQDEGDPTGRWR